MESYAFCIYVSVYAGFCAYVIWVKIGFGFAHYDAFHGKRGDEHFCF